MSSQSLQTVIDPVFRSKMPLFDGTIASAGLSKPQNMPGFLGKHALQYSGAYFTYDPRVKDGAGFTPPWSNSKTSLLDGRSPKPPVQPMTEFIPKVELQMPVRKHFLELHQSLCKLVSKSVSASSEQELRTWLSQLELTEPASPSTKVQKVSCLLGKKAREVWLNEEMKSALQKVLDRLREYTAQERCPFPHVMRTGAVFLPMLVVKELLFPMVQGSFVDQVLHEHKVELRPTTLSEEKILIQLHKRACSSRLRRLMSLKHLPDIYADVLNLLYYACVCKHLGLDMGDSVKREQDEGCEETNSCRSSDGKGKRNSKGDFHTRTPKVIHSAEHRRRWVLRSAVRRARGAMRFYYPDLVGKRIRHLYEEDDKSEVWYRGEVLRIHEAHTNPLKTIFEVRLN
eukprot:superscaffoldBa00000018_g371